MNQDFDQESQEWLDMPPIGHELGAPLGPLRIRDPYKLRFFIDTEFTDFDVPMQSARCELISIAIVGEDGSEFYAEVSDFDRSLCSDFVCQAVIPNLGDPPGRSMPYHQVRSELLAWLSKIPTKPRPVLCYDHRGDLDLLDTLLGGPLPKGWKTEDVSRKIDALDKERYFMSTEAPAHHALHDARANRFAMR